MFVGLNFHYQSLKAYFCGLIFVVCPEHVIIVAYCLDFRVLIFRFGALYIENKTLDKNFPLYGMLNSVAEVIVANKW